MSVSKIIYYAVDFTFLYQGRQLTTRSVATSTTWLSAGSDQIKIHCTYTNLFATPTIITIDTSFAFAENAVETSLSPNLQNVIIDGASTYTSWGASAIATTAETGGNVASNVSSSSDPATSNANGTAPVSHAHQSSIANGEIVGIGIGCAIIGALLASLIACLLLRRRSRRQGYSVATRSTSSGSAGESDKIPAIPLSRTIATGLSSALPQPEEDRTIIANVSKLDTVIKNHAHSFYAQATTFQPSEDAISLVEKLLYNCTAINARDLNTMLSKLDSRIGAVRFLLSWSVLSNVGYKSQVDYTLLPPALAECLSAMNLEDGTSPDRLALLSKWRHLTGALMPPSKTMSNEDPRQFNIAQLAKDLDDVLRFFASSDDKGRVENMTEIIRQGAYVGYVLFVQPTTWSFEWEEAGHSELVVFPALVQLSDEHGRPRARPLRSTSKQRVPRGR